MPLPNPADPHLAFVPIFETNDRLLLAMAKGLLDEAAVKYYVSGEEISVRPGMADAIFHRGCKIFVARDSESLARAALRHLASDN